MTMPRVGVFGGSFDPPHRGHLAVAKASADTFGLESVLFAPTGRQPLKGNGAVASFADRLTMTQFLTHADSRFKISDLDAPRADGSPNFTVDTLRQLRRAMPETALFAISGADSFLEIQRWREPGALLSLADWIVVSRPGFSLQNLQTLRLSDDERARIHLLETVHEEVSATSLRASLAEGEDVTSLLTPEVLAYIRVHRLYRT